MACVERRIIFGKALSLRSSGLPIQLGQYPRGQRCRIDIDEMVVSSDPGVDFTMIVPKNA